MIQHVSILSNEDLKGLIDRTSKRFRDGFDEGLSFDALKSLRLQIRELEAELANRESYQNRSRAS